MFSSVKDVHLKHAGVIEFAEKLLVDDVVVYLGKFIKISNKVNAVALKWWQRKNIIIITILQLTSA